MKSKSQNIPVTEQEAKVIRFICGAWRRGYLPSIREISAHCGWAAPEAAHHHVRKLQAKGLLHARKPGQSYQVSEVARNSY